MKGCYRRIRHLPADRGGKVPVIAFTDYARSDDRAKAFAAGFQQHLSKPMQSRELIAIIALLPFGLT